MMRKFVVLVLMPIVSLLFLLAVEAYMLDFVWEDDISGMLLMILLLLAGLVGLWLFFVEAGLHPALAGVMLAVLLVIREIGGWLFWPWGFVVWVVLVGLLILDANRS